MPEPPLPLFWMPRARDDWFKQIDFLAKYDADIAIRMGDAIAAAAIVVSANPGISRVGRLPGARELQVRDTPFILVYKVEDDAVVILRIIHNRRRWPTAGDAGVKFSKNGRKGLSDPAVQAMVKPVKDLPSGIERLPRRAQRDIERATDILREEFAKATAGRRGGNGAGSILKIILFGSYARGRQVIDPVGRYFSDYDLLVVVDHEDFTSAAKYWGRAEDRLVDMLTESGWPQPLSLIVHTLEDVNYQLSRGRYFWVDIAKDGIVLFEEPGFPLDKPGKLSRNEARLEAGRYYRKNFPDIRILLNTARYQRSQGRVINDELEALRLLNWSMFNLHQAMERAYYCIMLVLTLYSPKSHNLNFLSKRAEQLDERLIGVWKTETKFGKRCYELLRAAYVKARYSDHYRINDKELDWITDRVVELQELTRVICEERIAGLGDPGDPTA